MWVALGIIILILFVAGGTALVIRNNKKLFGEIDKKIDDLLGKK